MTSKQSHKSLFVSSMGSVVVRNLTLEELALISHSSKQISRGNKDAMKWIMLVCSLSMGIVSPPMDRAKVEILVKKHAKDAARIATEIASLTMSET